MRRTRPPPLSAWKGTPLVSDQKLKLGWIGVGRMGFPLVERLLSAGCDVSVFNRTRAKAEPLRKQGARLVDSAAGLADRDIVFTMIDADDALVAVTTGPAGVLTRDGVAPSVLVDSSTVSAEVSQAVREAAARVGTTLLAAPVSGNPGAVRSGNLTVVASGPRDAFDRAEPYLQHFGAGVSYVGDGDAARFVKMCHNLMLGAVTQSLAEITVLAQAAGISRAALFDFLNKSALGSRFSNYKVPAYVGLDFTPTFTTHLLRKDFELGLQAARNLDVPLPVASLVHQLLVSLIGLGHGDDDFATLLLQEAQGAGMDLKPEKVDS